MNLILLVALVAGSDAAVSAKVTTPIGVFSLPAGCKGGNIGWGIDAFMGSIECPMHGLTIFVFGSAGGGRDVCDSTGPTVGRPVGEGLLQQPVRLVLESGVPISVCRRQRKSGGRFVREIVIEVGSGEAELSASAQNVKQALLMLQIVSTLQRAHEKTR